MISLRQRTYRAAVVERCRVFGVVISVAKFHQHEDEEDFPGVVYLGETRVHSVQAALKFRFPNVEQRLRKDLKVLDSEYNSPLTYLLTFLFYHGKSRHEVAWRKR